MISCSRHAFRHSTQDITYMSYAQGQPRVVLLNIESGQREIVAISGHDLCAALFTRWPARRDEPPAGRQRQSVRDGFALEGDDAIDRYGGDRYLASYSPTETASGFESDRGGKQQIYVMSAAGGRAQRISFEEGTYSTPVWSPRGDYIAFTKQAQGRFAIGIMRPDGMGERVLTTAITMKAFLVAEWTRYRVLPRSRGTSGPSLYTVDISGRNEQRLRRRAMRQTRLGRRCCNNGNIVGFPHPPQALLTPHSRLINH